MRINANSWYYCPDHGQICQLIETKTLWGETTCGVWLPGRKVVVTIPAAMLQAPETVGGILSDHIAYDDWAFQAELGSEGADLSEMTPLLVIRMQGGRCG